MKGKLICIIGPDGSGKSTQAKILIDRLVSQGIECRYLWMRRPYIFSKPVLFLAKMLKLSKQEVIEGGVAIGYHEFYKSKFISSVFSVCLLIDTILVNLILVKIPLWLSSKTIICDRYVYDIVVDMSISTGKNQIKKGIINKLLFAQIPSICKTFILLGDEKLLKSRRNDVLVDKTINKKIIFYEFIASQYPMVIVSARLSIPEMSDFIFKAVSE